MSKSCSPRDSVVPIRRLVAAAVLAVSFVCATAARADTSGKTIHWAHVEGSVIYSVQEFPEGDWWYVIYDAATNKIIYAEEITGNPSPDGSSTALASKDTVDLLVEFLKKYGGGFEEEVDPWKTPLGLALLDQGIGPVPLTDPWDDGWLSQSGYDGDGGGGGYDPSVPWGEQMPNHRSDDDDDNGDTDKPDDFEIWDVDPELIDPPPFELEILMLLMELEAAEKEADGTYYRSSDREIYD